MNKNDSNSSGIENQTTGDELSREVAIRAHIDKSGVTVGARSRFVAATDRLLGGAMGIPAAFVEGIRARMEARNAQKLRALQMPHLDAALPISGTDEISEAAIRRFVSEEVGRQLNREAIWNETREALLSTPAAQPEETYDDSSQIDPDWLNLFTRHAENASTERVQKLWGQILAGEIRRPGAFSRSTLRLISEIDAEIANAFQEVALMRFSYGKDMYLLKPATLVGDPLLKLAFLEEVGLIHSVGGFLNLNISSNLQSSYNFLTATYILHSDFGDPPRQRQLPVIGFTRAGRQLAAILPWNQVDALDAVAHELRSTMGKQTLLQITDRLANGNVKGNFIKSYPTDN